MTKAEEKEYILRISSLNTLVVELKDHINSLSNTIRKHEAFLKLIAERYKGTGCRDCGAALEDDNIYGICTSCYKEDQELPRLLEDK